MFTSKAHINLRFLTLFLGVMNAPLIELFCSGACKIGLLKMLVKLSGYLFVVFACFWCVPMLDF